MESGKHTEVQSDFTPQEANAAGNPEEAPLFCNVCTPGYEGYLQCFRKLNYIRLPA